MTKRLDSFIASLTSTSIVPRLLLKRKLRPDTFRLLGRLDVQIILRLCRSDLPFPPMKPDRFSTQSYRVRAREMSSSTARRPQRRAYRARPRPAVGLLASTLTDSPCFQARTRKPSCLTSCSQSDPACDEGGFARADEACGAPCPVDRGGAGAFHDYLRRIHSVSRPRSCVHGACTRKIVVRIPFLREGKNVLYYLMFDGGRTRARTLDPLIKRDVVSGATYPLSRCDRLQRPRCGRLDRQLIKKGERIRILDLQP